MSILTVLITGANRGIGFELTKQYLAKGCKVIATCRDVNRASKLLALGQKYGDKLALQSMDICLPEKILQLSAKLALSKTHIDVLISNAGYLDRENSSIHNIDYASAEMSFKVNSLGPLYLAHAFLPLMDQQSLSKFIIISSLMGALTVEQDAAWYGYRMSKAAVNMLTVNLATELSQENIAVASLHPGWVKTDMGSMSADEEICDSVSGLIQVIDTLSKNQTGSFYRFTGNELDF